MQRVTVSVTSVTGFSYWLYLRYPRTFGPPLLQLKTLTTGAKYSDLKYTAVSVCFCRFKKKITNEIFLHTFFNCIKNVSQASLMMETNKETKMIKIG